MRVHVENFCRVVEPPMERSVEKKREENREKHRHHIMNAWVKVVRTGWLVSMRKFQLNDEHTFLIQLAN